MVGNEVRGNQYPKKSFANFWSLSFPHDDPQSTQTSSIVESTRIIRSLMLLARSPPPQFLLPAWGSRQTYQALQRAHKSDSTQNRDAPPDTVPQQKKLSLFDELFPVEEKATKSLFDELFPGNTPKKHRLKETEPEKLKPFEWNVGLGYENFRNRTLSKAPRQDVFAQLRAELKNLPQRSTVRGRKGAKQTHEEAREWRKKAIVLKLGNASTSLEESDFNRVGSKGDHISGWTSGIIKGVTDNSCV